MQTATIEGPYRPETSDCSSLGPFGAEVQRACNTQFEFVLRGLRHLDKIAIWQHAGDGLASLKTVRFDRFGLGLVMKLVTGLLAAVLLLAGVGASHAVVRIAEDRGGRIGTYVDKYQGLRSSGETVIIDGLCASACTIVLGAVPHDRICVTSHANLGFHAAWDFGADGRAVTNPRSDADAVFDVSLGGEALDRAAGRLDPAHDFPARQAINQHVPALLSRRPGILDPLRSSALSMT
jgi:hypothetical protein